MFSFIKTVAMTTLVWAGLNSAATANLTWDWSDTSTHKEPSATATGCGTHTTGQNNLLIEDCGWGFDFSCGAAASSPIPGRHEHFEGEGAYNCDIASFTAPQGMAAVAKPALLLPGLMLAGLSGVTRRKRHVRSRK